MSDKAGVPLNPPYTRPLKWHEKPWGKIVIGVIIGIILIFAGYMINEYVFHPAKQQQPLSQSPVK